MRLKTKASALVWRTGGVRCPECGEKALYSISTDVFFCHCGWDEELQALERA